MGDTVKLAVKDGLYCGRRWKSPWLWLGSLKRSDDTQRCLRGVLFTHDPTAGGQTQKNSQEKHFFCDLSVCFFVSLKQWRRFEK